MPGEKSTKTFEHGPQMGRGHFWRHMRHPVRNFRARWRKHIPLNFTSKMWKTEHKLEDLKEEARFYEERLNKLKNRIKHLEAETKKEAGKES